MKTVDYLIAGASHAGLEAVHSIRLVDETASITLITRDAQPPYSPTILPYIVSGQSNPDNVSLRDADYFTSQSVELITGNQMTGLDVTEKVVTLQNGEQLRYRKLLLATGADPLIPPIPGLKDLPYHVLRTMDDALGLRQRAGEAKQALVLGAGLIGMHAAENLHRAGLTVTLVEQSPQVLPGYFDQDAAAMIETVFKQNGVTMMMGRTAVEVTTHGDGCRMLLDDGSSIEADLLLIATGVKPDLSYLGNCGIETDSGILVDDRMRTSCAGVWAAGDVTQARDFYSEQKVMTGILPDAVEQARIAARDMTQDSALSPYPGGVPINTYTFFGQQAIAVGICDDGEEESKQFNLANGSYRKIIFTNDRLHGISCINQEMDAGVMWQLILRQVDLKPVKQAFIARPLETGRALMSSSWR
ncbi:MAG: FAD-dependent oxidoreductase [Gammaproteobacteria bacterium]|nr:FAD-dependent oxidoreductase [Gammaproteobacteria bacterium]